MATIRDKVQSLITKLQSKYGIQTKHLVKELKSFTCSEEGEDGAPSEDWFLVDGKTKHFCLPKTMLFLGRDECDVVVQSQSVDKRHAVVTYDHYLSRFKIKDLSTTNGTYVNESRIPEQEYVTLNHMDSVRLGFDTMVYHVEKGKPQPHLTTSESMPGWAVREAPAFGLAECEGCIAEQQIHHTCVHQVAEPNFVDMHRSFGKKESEEDTQNLGANTWPRKRLRHVRHHPHVLSVFSDDGQKCETIDQSGGSMTNNGYYYPEDCDGPHHPSCEHSMYTEKNNAHAHVPACVCYANSSNADYLDYAVASQANGVTRIPRSGSKHALPPELETVKKCTPLYGQPDWWGEEEQAETDTQSTKTGSQQVHSTDTDEKNSNSVDRPNSLCIEQKEAQARMDKSQGAPEYGIRYMEIPHRALQSEREKDTPPRSMSSSISKDSLFSEVSKLNTPDTPGDKIPSKEGTPDRAAQRQTDTAAMAFTIDFGSDEKKDKTAKTLSECVPSKIRKSFRERQEKSQRSQTKESTPSKSEEEQETAPPVQQPKAPPVQQPKKHEDMGGMVNEHKPLKRLSYPASKRASLDSNKRSSRETMSPPTKISENGSSSRKSDAATKATKSTRSKKSPSATRSTTKSPKQKPAEVSPIDPTQYKDPACFLIDKMFEGSGKLDQNSEDQDLVQPLTEHDLYKESLEYDVHNGDNIHRPGVNKEVIQSDLLPDNTPKAKKSKVGENVSKDQKEEDAISEAGTYTIDVDEESEELEESRRSIDQVFGLENKIVFERPVIDDNNSFSSDDQVEVTLDTDQKRALRERGSSMDVQAGSADNIDDLDIPDDIDLEDLSLAAMSTTDVPKWVSQWAALAKQRALKKSQSLDLQEGHPSVREAVTPNGRKRPGTGRKLPSIPPDQSPRSSDYSPCIGEVSPRSAGDVTPRQEDPLQSWPLDSPNKSKSVTISSQVRAHYQDANGDSTVRGRSGSGSDMSSAGSTKRTLSPTATSTRTNTSMDTEVLLQDTANVMAAMEARMADKNKNTLNGSINHYNNIDDSDSDSLVAVVNGDDKYVKPTINASPRVELSKRSKPKNVLTSTPKKPPLGKSLSVHRDQNVARGRKPRSYSLDHSATSETYSESSELGDSESYRSDVSSDTIGSSKKDARKGVITNTKPNRAFALRRAKADGPEESPRSSRTASTSRSSSRTPSSCLAPTMSSVARSTARSKSGLSGRYDSGKSEASLGAEIVKKSRENLKSSPPNFDRKDGGRHSLRNYKTNSEKTLSIFNPVEAARRSELKSLKTQLKKNEGSRELSVTGHAARSQSQPGSRSNSPKAAERLAWKRRRNYDPRKAVADAKAKAKENTRGKPLSSSQTSLALSKKKMWRSASFTNSAELSVRSSDSYKNGSVSSADDLSLNTSEAADSFDEHGLRRSFIPLSGPLRDKMSHSADEDESSLSLSSQDVSRSLLGEGVYKSAFTPTPPKLKSPATEISPIPLSPRSRRRTIGGIVTSEDSSRLSGNDSPQSYDTLLISSIYQLSLKLKTASDRTLNKLREHNRVSATPSPIDDFLSHSGNSEITAWKSANQELAGILKNLRKLEHHHQVMERALFPDEDSPTEVSGISSREKQKYFQEIERIRSELSGFQFIDKPESESWKTKHEPGHEDIMSPDMEEIGEEEFY